MSNKDRRSGMVAAVVSFLLGMGGCGSPHTPAPVGDVLVTVRVQDASGAPVPGAQIRLLRSEGTGVSPGAYLSDQDGRAAIRTDSLTHGALVSAPAMDSAVYESTRPTDDRLEITVTLQPSSANAGRIVTR